MIETTFSLFFKFVYVEKYSYENMNDLPRISNIRQDILFKKILVFPLIVYFFINLPQRLFICKACSAHANGR